jgi:predicted NUDIX family NTP pyrophosphohydrolase
MKLSEKIHFIIYRIRESGLEIFLLSHERDENLRIPHGKLPENKSLFVEDQLIELDAVEQENGQIEQAYAVEGDWHDIPSLKSMLKEDFHFVKGKIEEVMPELEKGTFVAVKEALKKVMPNQYAYLKELKDILLDRNSVKGI